MAELQADAEQDGLTLVTTEKDAARLRNKENLAGFAQTVAPFAVRFAFDDETMLRSFLIDRLGLCGDNLMRKS